MLQSSEGRSGGEGIKRNSYWSQKPTSTNTNNLNKLISFHPVHACLTHSVLCRTEFAEPFDCSFSSSPCMLDSLYFMQDRICWTNWLQLFIQSMHAWLTLFYAGQNLLNDLSLQLLCLLLQAHHWDCGYCMTPSSCCEKERFGFFSPVFGFFSPIFSITLPSFKPIAMMGKLLSSPSNLLPWWGNCYHHPLTLCHDGKFLSSPSNLLPWLENCYHYPLNFCHDGQNCHPHPLTFRPDGDFFLVITF